MDTIQQLIYLLSLHLPHRIIAAILTLADDPDIGTVHTAWTTWVHESYEYGLAIRPDRQRDMFAETVEHVTGWMLQVCESCDAWEWDEHSHATVSDGHICSACSMDWIRCSECGLQAPSHEVTWCDDYAHCDHYCRDRYLIFCETCDEYVREECDHDEGCGCEAPVCRFQFPANGHGTIANDKRLPVTLPAGTIDDVGIENIRNLLFTELVYPQDEAEPRHHAADTITQALLLIGNEWQARNGNYTRRLSRALYNIGKVKVTAGTLSEIGNLARQHSSESAGWNVEFTRDLNLEAEDFCHSDSCWWQSYYESRCALKNWGGIGLRNFDEDFDYPTGRAWVQPLNADLEPTHDALNAHAYVVYNCYGSLDGYTATRIVAHLTSNTYKKVTIRSDPQYINGDSGYLVGPEATLADTNSVAFHGNSHDTYDAHTINQEVTA